MVTRNGAWRVAALLLDPPGDLDGDLLAVAGLALANERLELALRARLEEQRALRRVATLSRGSATPSRRYLRGLRGRPPPRRRCGPRRPLRRPRPGAAWPSGTFPAPAASRWGQIETVGEMALPQVQRTTTAGRLDSYEGWRARTPTAAQAGDPRGGRRADRRRGRPGAAAATRRGRPVRQARAEARLGAFAELVALALAGADARHELAASRTRIVEAGDAARRRLERDLHDGAQQRLVAVSLQMRLARARIAHDPAAAAEILDEAGEQLAQGLEQLRELARGIHPALLTDRGLKAALAALASRAPFPVGIDVTDERFAQPVEVAVYYLVSEALTNAAKYAEPSAVSVTVERAEDRLTAEIADDGCGGADPASGTGLRGLADRVEALGGRLRIDSPPGAGTPSGRSCPPDLQRHREAPGVSGARAARPATA